MTTSEDHKPAAHINDDENPQWTREDFARARPGAEVLPIEVVVAFGRPQPKPEKLS